MPTVEAAGGVLTNEDDMTTPNGVRARDPPSWRDAERTGRVSYLPPRSMPRTYRSELRRRELMAAEDADWRRLESDIASRELSEAAFIALAAAFVELILDLGPGLAIGADGHSTSERST